MPLSILFWVLMIVWLIFGFYSEYVPGQPYPIVRGGRHLIIFILFGILGWAQFGGPVK